MSIMSAEMSLSELKIKQSRLESSLVGLYKRISLSRRDEGPIYRDGYDNLQAVRSRVILKK